MPTAALKSLVGCPAPAAAFEFVCGLPAQMPAQPVSTSVAIGPDGAYYVRRAERIPGANGRIAYLAHRTGTLHADYATSPACTIVADGFTSIVDLTFGPDGTLYVVELDEASWAAVEFQLGGLGGTVNACDVSTWDCTEVASELPMPIAAAVDSGDSLLHRGDRLPRSAPSRRGARLHSDGTPRLRTSDRVAKTAPIG